MPGRIQRRNPFSDALRRIKPGKRVKMLRAMLKKAVKWENARRQKKEISVLCARLQIPPKRLPQLFEGKREAREVVMELQHMVKMAEHAGLGPKATKILFQKAVNIKAARAHLEQASQGMPMAA